MPSPVTTQAISLNVKMGDDLTINLKTQPIRIFLSACAHSLSQKSVKLQPILITKPSKTEAWASAFSITIKTLKVPMSHCINEHGTHLLSMRNLWRRYTDTKGMEFYHHEIIY